MSNYEEMFCQLNPVIESQACYVVASCQRLYQSDRDWQGLAQGTAISLWRYWNRRGGNGSIRLLALIDLHNARPATLGELKLVSSLKITSRKERH